MQLPQTLHLTLSYCLTRVCSFLNSYPLGSNSRGLASLLQGFYFNRKFGSAFSIRQVDVMQRADSLVRIVFAIELVLYIAFSLADLFVTGVLLRYADGSVYESNPIARAWLE